ncbi:MAG: aldehyde dehydrogenase family protein [Verrucomicrobiota bacterium]|nr:aldehyde dehydrogenase family protein [Verrucomicrobiota bacterium]
MKVLAQIATRHDGVESESTGRAVDSAISSARTAQIAWASQPLRERLETIRRARSTIALEWMSLAQSANDLRDRPIAEILTSEILPLGDACRFLERKAEKILRSTRLGARGRPLWLAGVDTEIRREPYGVVLVIGTSNYPLFLPGVQALQALAAGNAVLIKPGRGGAAAATAFAEILLRAGLPRDLLHVLSESAADAQHAILCGVDKVFFTGNATTGETILAQCAETITPATVELSGCDAMFVRENADLDLVVRAIQFGLRLNNGATCIAPRRVFVHHALAAELEAKLRIAPLEQSSMMHPQLSECVTDALLSGADLTRGSIELPAPLLSLPIILNSVTPAMRIAREDIFAPVLSLITVADDDEALRLSAQCPYSLGATIFSADERSARMMAAKVRAGSVIINDLIVPTADPRVPFGGRDRSGFGTTRGAEGLLEMTVAKVVSLRRRKSHRHFETAQPGDAEMFAAYIQAAHGSGLQQRLRGLGQLLRTMMKRSRK